MKGFNEIKNFLFKNEHTIQWVFYVSLCLCMMGVLINRELKHRFNDIKENLIENIDTMKIHSVQN